MIKKIVGIFLLIVFLWMATPARAEEIRNFNGVFTLRPDGAVSVKEYIRYDFGGDERHGIFRTIPYLNLNEEGKKFILDFSDFSVVDDTGEPYQFAKTTSDNTISLKIGDPDATITGEHEYTIAYNVAGAITYFSDHDELYWNVTGNGWPVGVTKTAAAVQLPRSVPESQIRALCFTGAFGSQDQNCSVSYDATEGIVGFTATAPLAAGEGMSIVVGFPKGIVAVLEPREYVSFWSTIWGKLTLVLIILIAFTWYFFLPLSLPVYWWRHGRDPKPTIGVASAWFAPPKTKSGRALTPGETGTLTDERADMADVVSTIVDLARRGYIRIVEPKKGDINLEKLEQKDSSETIQPFEKTLLDGIFETEELVKIKTADLIKTVEETKKKLYEAVVSEGFFMKNPQTTRTLFTAVIVFAFMTGNFPLVLSAMLFGLHMPKKTILGADQAAVAKSLKNFLTSQERQLKFQAEKQLMFEKLLPFAIAFGVEKIWIARFAHITLKNPTWYRGYSSTAHFNAILFANTLSSASSSIAHAATPTSSSSGFSSGFSGGSSGGGGGGGGGGSW